MATTQAQPLKSDDSEAFGRNHRFFNVTQFGYGRGLGRFDVGRYWRENESEVFRLRTTFGYFVKPSLSLGMGFGLDGVQNLGFNTAPLVLDARYYLYPTTHTPFAAANVGYSLPLSQEFADGALLSANVGYRYRATGLPGYRVVRRVAERRV